MRNQTFLTSSELVGRTDQLSSARWKGYYTIIKLRRRTVGDSCHPVDHTASICLLRKQLGRTLDDGVVSLGRQDARGVLFQVTLLAYGDTFVNKATTSKFVRELEHEAKVYERLRPLPGVCVPVFLGAVDLQDVLLRH
jgi:hypothetical protein